MFSDNENPGEQVSAGQSATAATSAPEPITPTEKTEESIRAEAQNATPAEPCTGEACRTDSSSPIYGMPILDVDKSRTVMVIKRSMSAGFAGIDNPLYYSDKTLMLFGDAKSFVGSIVREISGGSGH